jgi:hypothetical protein
MDEIQTPSECTYIILKIKSLFCLTPVGSPYDPIFSIECCRTRYCEDITIDDPGKAITIMVEKQKRSFCFYKHISSLAVDTQILQRNIWKGDDTW